MQHTKFIRAFIVALNVVFFATLLVIIPVSAGWQQEYLSMPVSVSPGNAGADGLISMETGPLLAAPNIIATKVDLLPGGAPAGPGDTISYTVAATNTGDMAATNVVFSDLVDANTTMSGLVHVSPIAFDDSYAALGNVGIDVPAIGGLLVNDVDPDFNTGSLTIAGVDTSSTQGTVSVAADGGFTYLPPAGYEGTDTFSYAVSDGDPATPNGTAQVSITVNEVIWFIDNAHVCGTCDGRLGTPFNGLVGATGFSSAADEPDDIIFIYETGSGDYTGGITLQDNQTLIGQGATAPIANITGITIPPFSNPLPATGGVSPAIVNASGDGVALAQNNTLRGFNLGAASGFGVAGGNVGALNVSEVSINNTSGGGVSINGSGVMNVNFPTVSSSGGANGITLSNVAGSFTANGGSLSGSSGPGFNVSGGNATVTYAGSVSKSSAGRVVSVNSISGGAVSVSGNLTCNTSCTGVNMASNTGGTITLSGAGKVVNTGSNPGINLTNNTGATINFTGGGLDVDTTTGTGFNATGGGTVNVTGSNNTINTTAGTAVNIANTTIGASGISLLSVNATGGAGGHDGIILNNTSSGAFAVTGSGTTDGSGGTIQNMNNSGINLLTAQNVSISNMNLLFTAQSPAVATGSATCADESVGTNTACDAAVHMVGAGNVSLTNLTINDSNQHGINGNSVTNLTVSDVVLTNIGDNNEKENGLNFINLWGANAFNSVQASGSQERNGIVENNQGVTHITVDNSSFNTALREDGLWVAAGSSGGLNATMNLTVTNSTFFHNPAGGLNLHAEDSSVFNTAILNNTIDGQPAVIGNFGLQLVTRDNAVSNFLIDNQDFQPLRIHAVNIFALGGGQATGRVTNNSILETNQGSGVRVVAEVTTSGNPTVIIDISDNTLADIVGGNTLAGIHLEARDGVMGATGTANIQATVDNNNVNVNNAGAHLEIYDSDSNTVCGNFTNNTTSGTASFGDDFYIGNPVSGTGLGPGTVVMQGWTGNLQTTWTNNGNTGTTFNEGTNPVAGTCTTVSAPVPFSAREAKTSGTTPAPMAAPGPLAGEAPAGEEIAGGEHDPAGSSRLAATLELPAAHEGQAATPSLGPGGSFPVAIGTLPAGKAVVIVFAVTINDPLPAGVDEVCNQGSVTADGGINVLTDDPAVGGATDPTCTAVTAAPDMVLDKDDRGINVLPGQAFTYTLTYTNSGNQGATNVVISDTVPAATRFNAGLSSGSWSCADNSPPGTICQLNLGALGGGGAGGSVLFGLTVSTTVGGPAITNTAAIADDGANGPDQNPGDNAATEVTPVIAAPEIISLTVTPATIQENDTTDLVVRFDNPGRPQSHDVDVAWGDGVTETVNVLTGTFRVTITHQYLDDDPTGTGSDNYTIPVTVTGGGGLRDSDNTMVTVNNVPPQLTNLAVTPLVISETNTISLTGIISDPGTLDTFTLTVDWADGSLESFTYPAGTTTFLETHAYEDDGFRAALATLGDFVITLFVEDDDLGLSPTEMLTVTVDNVAPALSDLMITSPITENDLATLTGVINEVSPQDSFTLTVDWGDGSPPDLFTYPAGTAAFTETHQYLDDDPSGTPAGVYTATLVLADDNGGTDIATANVTVQNAAPLLFNLAATPVISENDYLTVTGIISDVGSLDTFTLTVDWGDGSPAELFAYPAGTTAFTATHQYLDDNPSGTPVDPTLISLVLEDDDTGMATGSAGTEVFNLAPEVAAGADASATQGALITFGGAFTDVGSLDTHMIMWNFGDGVTTTGTLSPTHSYLTAGQYTVTLTVTDDDTGVGSDTLVVVVEEPTDVGLRSFAGSPNDNGAALVLPALMLAGLVAVMVYRRQRRPG